MKKISVAVKGLMSKKFIIILVILILLAASQWWAVSLVYNKKLNSHLSLSLAKIYHLSAGRIVGPEQTFVISLADYLENIDFAKKYLASQVAQSQTEEMGNFQMPSDDSIKEAAWRKIAKDYWLNFLANKNNLSVSEQDIKDIIEENGSFEEYKNNIEQDLGLDFDTYERLVIKPSVLEAKVYQFLLENYNDREGMEKAQNAYDALSKDNKDFASVAKEYSDDMTYVDQSWFVAADDLGDFTEPVSKLSPGQYSQIVVVPGSPGAYIILKLLSSAPDPTTGKEVKELRGIAIQAKSIEDFFDAFLQSSDVKQWY